MCRRTRPKRRSPGRTDTQTPAPGTNQDPPEPSAAAADDPEEPETGPQRRCIVTRVRADREEMIRFVIGPDRQVVPDLSARLPGRGIWLSARRDVVETARTRGAFARAARGQVTVPSDLAALIQAGLMRRIGELLGLARRAGQAICGFQKAREWLSSGQAGLVMQAGDGSAEERARFVGMSGAFADVPVVTPLTALALGKVFGRDHVVHVAIRPGRLAEALKVEARRLSGMADGASPDAGRTDMTKPAAGKPAAGGRPLPGLPGGMDEATGG